jgi:hypothetical protein
MLCTTVILATLYQQELYFLLTYIEDPKDITSLGLLTNAIKFFFSQSKSFEIPFCLAS